MMYLFVYGTLQSGCVNHDVLENLTSQNSLIQTPGGKGLARVCAGRMSWNSPLARLSRGIPTIVNSSSPEKFIDAPDGLFGPYSSWIGGEVYSILHPTLKPGEVLDVLDRFEGDSYKRFLIDVSNANGGDQRNTFPCWVYMSTAETLGHEDNGDFKKLPMFDESDYDAMLIR